MSLIKEYVNFLVNFNWQATSFFNYPWKIPCCFLANPVLIGLKVWSLFYKYISWRQLFVN